ncbi:MAG TPA: alpha/beta hydrolase [Xanthobacteraceae bacterium]|nr:alpha/beta hydrolase [Xanthobacteraceae bacterium]
MKTLNDIAFAGGDGAGLLGDLYMPDGVGTAPVLVAVHGGGWQIGNRKFYIHWGPYLARHGIAVFAVEYRLTKPGAKAYPDAVRDVRAAVGFIHANAGQYGLDPERVGLIGDSAGAHLSALVALAGNGPPFSPGSNAAADRIAAKVVVGFYGVYDMAAQWQHDVPVRPRDNIAEKFLGAALYEDRRIYFESSPISYANTERNATRFLLIYGTHDDVVDAKSQSQPFVVALKQAGFFVRTVAIPGAGHFFITDPVDDTSYNGIAGPRVVRFLRDAGF